MFGIICTKRFIDFKAFAIAVDTAVTAAVAPHSKNQCISQLVFNYEFILNLRLTLLDAFSDFIYTTEIRKYTQ